MHLDAVERNARLTYRLMSLAQACAVLHFGAHPDDEDIGLLAYLTCKYGVRAVYWSATRGEGGQNRIGPYREEALGVYRTWESLAARAVDGGECLFGPFYDFGYSKNAQEALSKWGQEALVREVVRAIRLVQPHILVARWQGTPGDFHGHHQAVGLACREAFQAAGDPLRFPELRAQGLVPWQPRKFYHSLDNSGGDLSAGGAINISGALNPALERDGVVRLNTGEFDPVAGRTYQERAWLAYNRHRTQGMGLAPAPGDFYYYFALLHSLAPVPARERHFFEGLDPTLAGLTDYPGGGNLSLRYKLQGVRDKVQDVLGRLRADDPRDIGDLLWEGLLELRQMLAGLWDEGLDPEAELALKYYLSRKIEDFEGVLAQALGLELESLSDRARLIPGQRFRVSAQLWNHRLLPLDQVSFGLSLPPGWQCPVSNPFDDGRR